MITRCDYRLITMLSARPRRRDNTRCFGRSGSRVSALHASAYHSARLSAQVLLRLARAPAVVADADAAASRLFDEFPSLCVVVISLPVRPGADCLLMTSDDT